MLTKIPNAARLGVPGSGIAMCTPEKFVGKEAGLSIFPRVTEKGSETPFKNGSFESHAATLKSTLPVIPSMIRGPDENKPAPETLPGLPSKVPSGNANDTRHAIPTGLPFKVTSPPLLMLDNWITP